MEPQSKKRRLAPKVTDSSPEQYEPQQLQQQQRHEYPAALINDMPPSETTSANHMDFEDLARQLQDANANTPEHTTQQTYSTVSVLLWRWEDDMAAGGDLSALERLFKERYNFRTEMLLIPSSVNRNSKMAMQLAPHMEYARPGHLLILVYVGHSFMSADQNLYWALNSRKDTPKVKWETVKELIADSTSDILLLLDCLAPPPMTATGSNGIKQGIAAYTADQALMPQGDRSFTFNLIEALHKLGNSAPFNIQQLLQELMSHHYLDELDHESTTNGTEKPDQIQRRTPVVFNLTTEPQKDILLAPFVTNISDDQFHSPLQSPDTQLHDQRSQYRDPAVEDMRALVSLTFQGEASHDMASFTHWLTTVNATGADAAVEGMFQGPSTLMIISMPIAVWHAIQNDRTYVFLGYVKSRNMLIDAQSLPEVASVGANRYGDDGKILLDTLEVGATSPDLMRHNQNNLPQPNLVYTLDGQLLPQQPASMIDPAIAPERKEEEDSDEMHEAAIQLKALSHVRTVKNDTHGEERKSLPNFLNDSMNGLRGVRDTSQFPHRARDHANEDHTFGVENHNPAARPKQRRSMQKQPNGKQETRCNMCSHAPFKDSSSLRKHIAAAHTRPFPCAFSFAGCTSTFGSKNEWKRHIASQHLCLTYYRCSTCPQSTVEGKGNEFNRKDLFTQHLRRMHAPFTIKKQNTKTDPKLAAEWEAHVKEMQTSCLVIRRSPPQRSACPKPDCSNVFEGAGSWDDWTEHVGRHMEKGDATRLGVDRLLAQWALDEGIIERKDNGEFKLVGEGRDGAANNSGYYSDGASRIQDDQLDDHSMMEQTIDHMLQDNPN